MDDIFAALPGRRSSVALAIEPLHLFLSRSRIPETLRSLFFESSDNLTYCFDLFCDLMSPERLMRAQELSICCRNEVLNIYLHLCKHAGCRSDKGKVIPNRLRSNLKSSTS